MIFSAWDSGALCSRLAVSRPSATRATMDGRQCRVRRNARRETGHRLAVVRVLQAFDQPHRVDQKGADDRRVQALVVEHQHRLVQPRLRIHDEAAGACGGLVPRLGATSPGGASAACTGG
jgi:hypothetical protein